MRAAIVAVFSCFLLTGCDMPSGIFDYGSDRADDAEIPQAASQPIAAAAGPSTHEVFCQAVAKQDATSNGFDPATQQRVYQASYAQCLAIHGT